MRKLIRKILREDEWDFIRDTEAKLVKGMYLCSNNSKKFASSHTVVTRVDEGMVYTTDLKTSRRFADPLRVIMEWLKSGEMRICDPLNESNDMDWIENTNPVPLSGHDIPRKGEHLVCLPGFSNSIDGHLHLPYAGAGYEEGKVITVDRVSLTRSIDGQVNYDAGHIVWPVGDRYEVIWNNLYQKAMRFPGIFSFALARI